MRLSRLVHALTEALDALRPTTGKPGQRTGSSGSGAPASRSSGPSGSGPSGPSASGSSGSSGSGAPTSPGSLGSRSGSSGAAAPSGLPGSPGPQSRPRPTPPRAGREPTRDTRATPSDVARARDDGRTESQRRGVTEYDAEHFGAPVVSYAPDLDGDPDPGEVVWGWVPYEEDPDEGKDRPMLVLGTGGGAFVAVQLTSKDRAVDGRLRVSDGRIWFDVGTGGWDRHGRPSEARLDRLLRVEARAVRREGAALSRERFDEVVAALRTIHGW